MSHADATLVAAFEQACRDAQVASTRAAAELSLNHISSRPDAIAVALAVTERTTSSVARFHAAAALRAAARERWSALRPHQRYGQASLRYWLVNNVVSNPTLLAFERKALLRTAAFLTRRAYLEENPDDRNTFFALVCKTAVSSDSYAAIAASELMDLIGEEFLTPSLSPSAPGIEREMLMRAREQFAAPSGDMVRIFRAAKDALSVLCSTDRSSVSAQTFESCAVPALSTIFRILAADFKSQDCLSVADSVFELQESGSSGGETLEAVVINTFVGSQWAEFMDDVPELLRICFAITGVQLTNQDPDNESEVLSKATQIIIAIAAISQASYRPGSDTARQVLAGLLNGVHEQKWCASPIGSVRLAYAEVWRRVSCAHGLTSVESLGGNHVQVFTKDTCHEMDAAAVRLAQPDGEEDVFSMDVTDMLLETWANLALQADDGSPNTEHNLSSNIEQVISHFIRMSLRSTGEAAAVYAGAHQADTEEDLGFEDTSIDDSRLCVAAILTRFVLDKMVLGIRESLLGAAQCVFGWSAGQGRQSNLPLDLFQEDLYFLIRLTCAVLADEAKGEFPSVPSQFLPVSEGNLGNGQHKPAMHARTLILAVMEVAQGETNLLRRRNVHCEEASPRVGSAILDALSRICRTYLVPFNVSSAATTFEMLGGKPFIESGINVCFEKAREGLSLRGFEDDVSESAALLLSTLASGASSYPHIRESQYWQQLLQQGAEAYQTLPPKAVQEVGKSLTRVVGDVVADRLLIPAYNSLQSFSNAQSGLADAAERAIATVNLLRGAAKCDGVGSRTRAALLLSLSAPDGVAASCAKGFGRTRPDVSRSLINLADDIVYSSLPILSEPEARGLLTNAVKLVKLHTEIVASHRNDMAVDELSCDIEDMLSLLSRILDEEVDLDVGEACYYGLSTIMPLMSEAALSLPAVGAAFFRFVTRLVCCHPEKLCMLPAGFCKQILHSIDVQRGSMDVASERRGLEAIAALAEAWIAGKKEGPGRSVVETALRGFVTSIFNGIASGSAHMTNLDAAADALLPLIHIRYAGSASAVEELGQALLLSSGNSVELRNGLQELGRAATQAGAAFGYDESRQHREDVASSRRALRLRATKSFREAVARFSSDARNCLLSVAIGARATQ